MSPPIVSFVARSGTGKTTFLEQLIPALALRGVRVMVVKHDVHGFEVDKPGKDTWRLRQAGAHRVLIANADKMALMGRSDGDLPLLTLVQRYGGEVDLVISEGYRRSSAPKILVARRGSREALDPALCEPLIGAVSDHDLGLDVPQWPLDDPGPCADWIVQHLLPTTATRALTGVLLAGGHSKRMGSDKASLRFRGEPLLPVLCERLDAVCEGGVLVVRRPGQELPALPSAVRVVDDLLPDHASLGGLYTGLALAPTPFIFLAGCDMPLLDAGLVRWLAAYPERADVLLPERDGYPEPLHAIYGHKCLGAIKEALLSGELKMRGWHGAVRVAAVSESAWRGEHKSGDSFINANTPERWAEVEGR